MNKISQMLWNIISGGLPSNSDIEVLRKTVLLNFMFLLGVPCLFLFIFIAYAKGDILLAAVDSTVLVFLIALFAYLRKTSDYQRTGILGTTATGLLFTFQIATGGIGQTVLIWSLTYPLIALFLLGFKRGVQMALLLLALAIAIFYLGVKVSWFATYQTDIIIRFIAVYLLIFLFSFSMEKVRDRVQKQLEASNLELQNALTEVQEGSTALAESNRKLQVEITEHKRAEETIKALSIKDDLTGLYNRRGFFTLAEQGLKTAQRMEKEMSLIYGDVDNLKEINDIFGHHEGDQALIDMSHILNISFRESDVIARMGGDEFVILAMNSNEDSAEKLIARFEKALNDYRPKDRPYTLSMSLGIVCFDPKLSLSMDDLLGQADNLMYKNKRKKLSKYR